MKVMAKIPDFAPGPWCQTSPPDNEAQPVISLLGPIQSWGSASRVGVRKTSLSQYSETPWGKEKRTRDRAGQSMVLQSCYPFGLGQLVSPSSALSQEGRARHSISWE